MFTFLVTPKMSPELAERVRASVRGRNLRPGMARTRPRVPRVLRFAVLLLALVGFSSWAIRHRQDERNDLEDARRALLTELHAQRAPLTAEDRDALARAEVWVARALRPYEGDAIDDALRAPGALSVRLAESSIYVRGPMAAFADNVTRDEAVLASKRDALVMCLLAPPHDPTEKAVVEAVRAAYSASAGERFVGVHPLRDVAIGLPLLAPPWEARVEAAARVEEVGQLRRDFERANVANAVDAAKARSLLFALDEPSDVPVQMSPTELDGERPHTVRIELVDLPNAKVLLRVRRRVDPSWISEARRAEYASGLDSCALAYAVTNDLTAKRE